MKKMILAAGFVLASIATQAQNVVVLKKWRPY